ncbi:mandelate racemase/muconate lactonizing enzyme family protein [Peribacillus muralis]|nr:mandelate racemase/muconate lactonizing enzyme family protein [Peribacillus muralis]
MMKIIDVRTAVVEANFDWTYVRVYTDKGTFGTGECFFAPGLTNIIEDLKQVIIGKDPRNIERLFVELQHATSGAGSIAGFAINAITGIESALWDLKGKELGVPIYQLLGGKYRDKIRIYCDAHGGDDLESLNNVLRPRQTKWMTELGVRMEHENPDNAIRFFGSDNLDNYTPEAYAKQARETVAKGFNVMKFDVDVPSKFTMDDYNRALHNMEIKQMVGFVEAIRKEVGWDIDIAIDCHWRYNPNDALRLAWELEPYGLLWLEDPTPPENLKALCQVTKNTKTPIASGENLYLRHAFREVLESGAMNIIAPDFQKVGGIWEAKRISDMAENYFVGVVPHNIASPIGTLASVHVAAASLGFIALEYHADSVPFWNDLLMHEGEPLIQNGYIKVPEGPGLGYELNEIAAKKYAKEGELFFGEVLEKVKNK